MEIKRTGRRRVRGVGGRAPCEDWGRTRTCDEWEHARVRDPRAHGGEKSAEHTSQPPPSPLPPPPLVNVSFGAGNTNGREDQK